MAVKTITIDLDAYERLKNLKRSGESFSDVIKRLFKPPLDLKRLQRDLGKLSDEAVDAIEDSIETRRRGVPKGRKVA